MRLAIISLLFLVFSTGCSWMPFVDSEEEIKEQKAEQLKGLTEKQFYERIQNNLRARNWADAVTNLQAFEAQFPFGNYADQAQLELIYAYFESLDYEAAIAASDRFIRLHPRHENVDYAFYIKGLAAVAQEKGFFAEFMPTDDSRRDLGEARRAFATFSELVSLYPNSSYAADARKRLLFQRSMLARHEIHVANYYFKRGAYLAAANRGRYVVENFQQTPAVPDGLAVMAQAYYMMGFRDLADDAARVLASNYSNHPALDTEGKFKYQKGIGYDESGWRSRLTFGYIKTEKPPHYDSRKIYNPVHRALDEFSKEGQTETTVAKRSWLSRLSFGLLN